MIAFEKGWPGTQGDAREEVGKAVNRKVHVSAAFFSPSHVCRCSFSHYVASIAPMNT